jgi:hypothetical protein
MHVINVIKICFTLRRKEYPKSLESTAENGALLVAYQLVKYGWLVDTKQANEAGM